MFEGFTVCKVLYSTFSTGIYWETEIWVIFICFKEEPVQPAKSPVHPSFLVFLSGSLVERFTCLTGPDSGPVHGSTGWTGRSGFDYLGCSLHYSYKSYLWYISSQRETSNTTPYVQDWTRWNVKSTVTGGPKYGRSPQPTTNESTINSNTILEFEMYILKCKS
jgi:hypothetical protein